MKGLGFERAAEGMMVSQITAWEGGVVGEREG